MAPHTQGRGIAFPPRLDRTGRLAWSVGPDNVRDAIRIILATEPGERVMLPSFGAGLGRLLSEPNTPATHRLVEERVRQALTRWETRIRLDAIQVTADPLERQQANVTIVYTLLGSGDRERVAVTARLEG